MADVTLERSGASADDDRPAERGPSQVSDLLPVRPAPADPRAVRVAIAPASRLGDMPPIVVAPPPQPLAPTRDSLAGKGPLGGATHVPPVDPPDPMDPPPLDDEPARGPTVVVDGLLLAARLAGRGAGRASLLVGEGSEAVHHRVVFTSDVALGQDGMAHRELVVDGWRIEVELEAERRAALRERARKGREATARGGPTEVRAIIPGRVVSVSVAPGDAVTAGQQVLVVEAMKMQNELRAPRDGTVDRVAVAPGVTIEVGDLLLVME